MSDLARNSTPHIKLFLPGPTEVRPEILDAQTRWMIGHRMPECATLFHNIQGKIRPVFYTQSRVYINAALGPIQPVRDDGVGHQALQPERLIE